VYNVFRGVVVGGFQTLFPIYMRETGYSMESIGLAVSVASLFSALTSPAFGVLIDRHGPKNVVIATGVMLLLSTLILCLPPSYTHFIASYALFYFGFMFGQPARASYVVLSVPSFAIGWYIGVVSTSFGISQTLGPVVGGYLSGTLGFQETFALASLMVFTGTIVFAITAENVRAAMETGRTLDVLGELKKAYASVLRPRGALRQAFLLVGVDRLAWSLWYPMLSAHLYGFGYSTATVGALMTLTTAIQTLLVLLGGRLTDIIGARKTLFLAEVAGAVGTAIVALPVPLSKLVSGVTLIGCSIGLWIPSYNKLLALVSDRDRLGVTYATTNAVRSLTSIPPPYIGGFVYDLYGPIPVFAISSALIAYSGLLAFRVPVDEQGCKASEERSYK